MNCFIRHNDRAYTNFVTWNNNLNDIECKIIESVDIVSGKFYDIISVK